MVRTGVLPPNGQACRNWNYQKCRAMHCRYLYICILCGSSHQVSYCPLGNNGQSLPLQSGPHRPIPTIISIDYNLPIFPNQIPPHMLVSQHHASLNTPLHPPSNPHGSRPAETHQVGGTCLQVPQCGGH